MIRKRGRRKKRVCQCCASQKNHRQLCKAPESADNSNQESKTRIPDALYTGLIRYCFGRSAGFALFLAEKQEKP